VNGELSRTTAEQLAHVRATVKPGPPITFGGTTAEPREAFPAPREEDCAHGCCKAGDVGLYSEVVEPAPEPSPVREQGKATIRVPPEQAEHLARCAALEASLRQQHPRWSSRRIRRAIERKIGPPPFVRSAVCVE
jgi:hypothetical protein